MNSIECTRSPTFQVLYQKQQQQQQKTIAIVPSPQRRRPWARDPLPRMQKHRQVKARKSLALPRLQWRRKKLESTKQEKQWIELVTTSLIVRKLHKWCNYIM